MPERSVSPIETLLRQSGWARALARRLVQDASEADELVQEAFVVALQNAPSHGVPVLTWFTTVLRNLARARWRARVRREVRERACAGQEGSGPANELLERFEQQCLLAEELGTIPEPYRSVLLMRYFDGLRPVEIARRSGESVRTIHSRLHRGLALLRERLLRRADGDPRAWMLALAPLGFARDGVSGSLLGGWIVNTQLKVATVMIAVGALAVTVTYWPVEVPLATLDSASERAPGHEVVEQTTEKPLEQGETSERAALEVVVPATTPLEERSPQPIERTVSGRVLDCAGFPVAGLEMGLRAGQGGNETTSGPRALTLADGRFVLRGPALAGRITILSQDWIPVFEAAARAPWSGPGVGEDELLILAAKALSISGTVVDARTSSIADAELEYVVPSDIRSRFPGMLDGASAVRCSSRTDARGSFRMPQVPDAPGGEIRVRSAGFEDALVEVPQSSQDDLLVVLQEKQDVILLTGTVVDQAGEPIEGAAVVLGNANTRSDASGSFVLSLDATEGGERIRAVKRGYLPASVECSSPASHDANAWPRPLILELGESPLSIDGVVLDANGDRVPHARVSIVDRTFLGVIDMRFGAESIEAPQWIEDELSGSNSGASTTSDEFGRFDVDGLLVRTYTLQAFDPRTLAHALVPDIEAGAEKVEIRLTCTEALPTLRGRVISRSGKPIEGASVLPVRRVPCNYQETQPPYGEREVTGQAAKTDEEGRFEIRSLCSETFALRASPADSFDSQTVQLRECASLEDIQIVLALQCHLQVDLEGSSLEADALHLLDTEGEDVTLVVYHGQISYACARFGIEGKKSEAFVVPDDAATLVLLKDGMEVARIPLQLEPGVLNVIRP